MDNEYGYANARLRAMKSRLLTRSVYNELLNEPSVEDVVAALTQTIYQPEIEAALIKSSGWECLSEALRAHLAQSLAKITKFFGGTALELWNILAARWQVFNIKTLLRGQANHVPANEILDALVPAGDLGESDFKRLVQQTSVRATVDLLATWNHPLARPLLQAMPRYAESSDLTDLELALDRARYKSELQQLEAMDDENAKLVKELLCSEIDGTNLLTVARLSAAQMPNARFAQRYGTSAPQAILIDGGGIVTQRLMAYREIPTLEQLVRDVRGTELGEALARAEARYNEKHSLAVFEDEIENQLARQRFALFQRDPLSIGIAVAYLAALVNEVRNLRVIGRGKSAGWKREEIEKELRLWLN
jgi:V/A-type H+-transporting ATPase subunit C